MNTSLNKIFACIALATIALASCSKPEQTLSSVYSVSDEYLGMCFIQRSPLALALIDAQLPDPTSVTTEEYVAAVEEFSDRTGEQLFAALRAEVVSFRAKEIDEFHAYCERSQDPSDDIFFNLERIVAERITE